MNTSDSIFQRALSKLLTEIFDGPPGNEAYLLNPGDPGLLGQLETVSASAASKRPMPGKTTIASYVDHVHYGFSLLNRWEAGEANPFAGADLELNVEGSITARSVLDALEARYPMLRGTIRDHVSGQRRPMLRFFACEEDLSLESPDAPLPEAVASGKEPFFIIGAIAGG